MPDVTVSDAVDTLMRSVDQAGMQAAIGVANAFPRWTYDPSGNTTPGDGTFTFDGTNLYVAFNDDSGVETGVYYFGSNPVNIFLTPTNKANGIVLFSATAVISNQNVQLTGTVEVGTLAADLYSFTPAAGQTAPPISAVLATDNDAGAQNITNLADPVNPQDATTMAWVEDQLPGEDIGYIAPQSAGNKFTMVADYPTVFDFSVSDGGAFVSEFSQTAAGMTALSQQVVLLTSMLQAIQTSLMNKQLPSA